MQISNTWLVRWLLHAMSQSRLRRYFIRLEKPICHCYGHKLNKKVSNEQTKLEKILIGTLLCFRKNKFKWTAFYSNWSLASKCVLISIICLPKLDRAEPKKGNCCRVSGLISLVLSSMPFMSNENNFFFGETHWLIKKPPEYRRVTVTFNALKEWHRLVGYVSCDNLYWTTLLQML